MNGRVIPGAYLYRLYVGKGCDDAGRIPLAEHATNRYK